MQTILYTIPRRASWAKGRFLQGGVVCITKRTDTHVTGYFQERKIAAAESMFTVKHDGKCFSQGSGSSKKRYYFVDSDKRAA